MIALELPAEGSFFQLDWFSKRQAATAHSTTEAELISASKMLRDSLVPLMGLWSVMLDREIKGKLFEDNMSTIIKVGYSATVRHLVKHHRISLGVTHEMCLDPMLDVEHVTTDKQKGDLLTKGLARPKLEPACRMVGLCTLIRSIPCVEFDQSAFDCMNHVVCAILDRSHN